MKKNSIYFYIVLFVLLSLLLKYFSVFEVSWAELFAYISLFWGMAVFYYSYLKVNKTGVFFGSLLFLLGVTLLSLTWFELYEPGRIFVPIIFTVTGISLLLSNLLLQSNKFLLVISLVATLMGISLTVSRGETTFLMFVRTVYELFKQFWLIVILLCGVVVGAFYLYMKE